MLETEEIEDDYFTPLPNASLKNIFGSPLQNTPTDSDALKYSPPKAEALNSKPADTPATECLFACALIAHEWSKNAYKLKGKLGLAIVKTTKTNVHSIILYDSSKTTISRTTVTPKLKIFIKGKLCLSFYDDRNTYWKLLGEENVISEMVVHFKKLNVQVVPQDSGKTTLEANEQDKKVVTPTTVASSPSYTMNDNKQSDTDSSSNRRTKVAILNRMASMGHSVLPRYTALERKDSESSSSTDSHSSLSYNNESNKATKPNPHPKISKRINASKEVAEISNIIQPTNTSLYPFRGQLVHNVCNNNGGELGCFISEQRISNTELRMNMNKTNDKVDQVLDLLKNFTSQGRTENTNFQIDITNKLINEYESKIKIFESKLKSQPVKDDTVDSDPVKLHNDYERKMKVYEEKLQALDAANNELRNEYENKLQKLTQQMKTDENKINVDHNRSNDSQTFTSSQSVTVMENEMKSLRVKIHELEEKVKSKETLITELQQQIKENESQAQNILSEKENDLLRELSHMKEVINSKDEKLAADAILQEDSFMKTEDFDNKLKTVMNEVFQLISVNFEDNHDYSGEDVKTIVAAIKKVLKT